MLDGKLYTAPIPKEQKIHRVLDVGTGTGIWAIDYADEHPEAQVYGIDLSPIQPDFIPPNVTFEVDDLEEPWTFSHKFDFIFSRMMVAGFANFPRFFEQSFENLNAGGWIELVDICFPVQCDDGTLAEDAPLRKWYVFIKPVGLWVC
jgi:cyclopropane fatty-acyl-phospholipid synthase-like methyltransferase